MKRPCYARQRSQCQVYKRAAERSNWTVWAWEFKLDAQEEGAWSIIYDSERKPPKTATSSRTGESAKPTRCTSYQNKHSTGEIKRKITEKRPKGRLGDSGDAFQSQIQTRALPRRQELNNLRMRDFKSMSAFIDAVIEKPREL